MPGILGSRFLGAGLERHFTNGTAGEHRKLVVAKQFGHIIIVGTAKSLPLPVKAVPVGMLLIEFRMQEINAVPAGSRPHMPGRDQAGLVAKTCAGSRIFTLTVFRVADIAVTVRVIGVVPAGDQQLIVIEYQPRADI